MTASSRFVVTLFPDLYAQEKYEQKVTAAELASWIKTTTAPAKTELPWIKLASFGECIPTTEAFATTGMCGLSLVSKATMTVNKCRSLMHSTRSTAQAFRRLFTRRRRILMRSRAGECSVRSL